MIIIAVLVVGIAVAVPVVWAKIYLPFPTPNPNWPSDCGTTFKVLSSDVTNFDASDIKEKTKQKFSDIDGSKAGAGKSWWSYVKIGEPNDDGVFDVIVPGHFREETEEYGEIIEILENLEQISKVTSSVAECS